MNLSECGEDIFEQDDLECQDRNKRRTVMHSVLLFLRKIKLKLRIMSNRVRMKCNLRK